MADFCVQCAKELGFEKTDFPQMPDPPEGMGFAMICEGCGFILVDGKGNCLGTEECVRDHKPQDEELDA